VAVGRMFGDEHRSWGSGSGNVDRAAGKTSDRIRCFERGEWMKSDLPGWGKKGLREKRRRRRCCCRAKAVPVVEAWGSRGGTGMAHAQGAERLQRKRDEGRACTMILGLMSAPLSKRRSTTSRCLYATA
jgi:hypothetical protein